MIDPAMATIVSKSLAALLLICGGIYAIYVGQKLFRDGVGLRREKSELRILNQIRFTTTSVGGGLMLTAVVWGWLGSHSLPAFSKGHEEQVSELSPLRPNFLQRLGPEIAFAPNKSTLEPAEKVKIDQVANLLKTSETSHSHVIIRVSTPKANSDFKYNLDLAQARADAVKTALMKAGVNLTGVTTLFEPYGPVGATNVAVVKHGDASGARSVGSPPMQPPTEAFKPIGKRS